MDRKIISCLRFLFSVGVKIKVKISVRMKREKVDSERRSPFRKVLRSTACLLHLERAQGPVVCITLNHILQHRKKKHEICISYQRNALPITCCSACAFSFGCFPLFASIYMIISVRR